MGCLAKVVDDQYGPGDDAYTSLVRAVRNCPGATRLESRTLDSRKTRELVAQLRIEWTNEVGLHAGLNGAVADRSVNVMSMASTCATAAHSAVRALFVAMNDPVKRDHTATANSVTNLATQRSLWPFPWNTYLLFPRVGRAHQSSRPGDGRTTPHGVDARSLRGGSLDPIRKLLVLTAAARRESALRKQGDRQQAERARGGLRLSRFYVSWYDTARYFHEHLEYVSVDTLLEGPLEHTRLLAFQEATTRLASLGTTAVDTITAELIGPEVYAGIAERFLPGIARLSGESDSANPASQLLARFDAITRLP